MMLFKLIEALTEDVRGSNPPSSSIIGSSSIPKRDKELTRGVERFFKEVAPPVGSALELLNNAADSADNLRDAMNPANRLDHVFRDLTVEEARTKFRTGDHIAAMRLAYSHHGIYDGHGGVYEYDDYKVRHSSLRKFAEGDRLYLVNEGTIYSPAEIVYRAASRLGEDNYNIIFNNCEHFATWCRLGEEI